MSSLQQVTRLWTVLAALSMLMAVVIPMAARATDDLPRELSLSGEWDFYYTRVITYSKDDKKIPELPDTKEYTTTMPVPGYWDDNYQRLELTKTWARAKFDPNSRKAYFPLGIDPGHLTLPNLTGTGYYRKVIDVPADWKNRSVMLRIGGARIETWVFLNGRYVDGGHHEVYNVPFEVKLNKYLEPGARNEIIIIVSNERITRGRSCAVNWYVGRSAGIYGPVTVKVAGPVRIADYFVHPKDSNKNLVWLAELDGQLGQDLALDWEIKTRDRTSRVIANGSVPVDNNNLTWTTESFFGMKPWSDNGPNLYRIELTLKNGAQTLDQVAYNFGLRTPSRDGIGLRLNGRPVMFRGITESYEFSTTVTAPFDIESYQRLIRRLKEQGFNYLRFHSWVPSEEYLRAADEAGMMVQIEGTGDHPESDWIQIIRSTRRHPSVVVYCCGNEKTLTDEHISWAGRMGEIKRQMSPETLFSPMEALFGVNNFWTMDELNMGEGFVEKPIPHNPRRLALLQEFTDVFSPIIPGYSFSSSYAADWRVANEHAAMFKRPILHHEMGIVGGYINLDLESRYWNIRSKGDIYTAAREYLTREGVLDKAPIYFQNNVHLQRAVFKHVFEQARLCQYMAGYNMHTPWDLMAGHRSGYPCGMTNEFFEFKPGTSRADILKFSGESVVLLDCHRDRNLAAGKQYSYDIKSSLYGEGPMDKGTLTWYLADMNGRRYAGGQIPVKNAQNGKIETLGEVSFTAPELDKPAKLKVYAQLSGGVYGLSNDWDFWVFPKDNPPAFTAAADKQVIDRYSKRHTGLASLTDKTKSAGMSLRVVSALDADSVEFLSSGGRVVLLGGKPFPTRQDQYGPLATGRADGDLATVIAEHPLMNRFPHENWCDWQFLRMLDHAHRVVFNDLGLPFDPIIESVSSWKYVRRQGVLFEYGVGRGKLLVCTMNMYLDDPAAMYLLDQILDYAAGNEFRPKHNIEASKIQSLLEPLGTRETGAITPDNTPP